MLVAEGLDPELREPVRVSRVERDPHNRFGTIRTGAHVGLTDLRLFISSKALFDCTISRVFPDGRANHFDAIAFLDRPKDLRAGYDQIPRRRVTNGGMA